MASSTFEIGKLQKTGKITIGLVGIVMGIKAIYLLAGLGLTFLYPLCDLMWFGSSITLSDLVFYGGGIFYLVWLHKAFSNLESTGLTLKHSPNWAVGCHFVPFVNLVEPLRAMRQLYSGSKSMAENHVSGADLSFETVEASSMVQYWWIFLVVPRLFEALGYRFVDHDFIQMWGGSISSALYIASGFLLIRIIREINGYQLIVSAERVGTGNQGGGSDQFF